LNGKQYTLRNSKKVINPNSEIKLKKLGFKKGDTVDDLTIKFDIVFPNSISDENSEVIQNIL
jgi:DnaJ-class molecular chaperone